MSKAEELGRKEQLTEDDMTYIMYMDHVEYREYSTAKSKDHGLVKNLKELDKKSQK